MSALTEAVAVSRSAQEAASPDTASAIRRSIPAFSQRVRILRLIARLNIGGPAVHVDVLSAELDPARFETWLVSGVPEEREGERPPRTSEHVRWIRLPRFRRTLHPLNDLLVLWQVVRLCQQFRPHIVHTHTAKAGAIGRLAAWWYNMVGSGRRPGCRCVTVHTFHGHVLEGYFSPVISRLFSSVERWLARRTDCLVTVGSAVRDELLARRIGEPERIVVVPLGLHLEALLALPPTMWKDEVRIGMVGRLVPIKRHALFLQAMAHLAQHHPTRRWRAWIVGDGPQREAIQRDIHAFGLEEVVTLTGWQEDLSQLYREMDIVCLTSRQEGTPVSLIEAMAAGRAVISTDAGSVRDLLGKPSEELPMQAGADHQPQDWVRYERGVLVTTSQPRAFANALAYLLSHPNERCAMGLRAKEGVRLRYAADRLVRDMEELYHQVLVRSRRVAV